MQIDQSITLSKDSYTIIKLIGKGGQGSVWKAKRHSDQKIFALKTVLSSSEHNGRSERRSRQEIIGGIGRLNSEIEFLKKIRHSKQKFIVPYIDSGTYLDAYQNELPVLVMPFYQQTLDNKLPPYHVGQIPPSFQHCVTWIEQMLLALQATHSMHDKEGKTFIHRDFKTGNLMLTDDGDIRLIDFGIAHAALRDRATKTRSGSVECVAPEQILPSHVKNGKNQYSIGSYSDIYALGTVIYRLFLGDYFADAQEQLADENVRDEHTTSIRSNRRGLLGTIGGLTALEKDKIKEKIIERLQQSGVGKIKAAPPSGTLVFLEDDDDFSTNLSDETESTTLPNEHLIADAFIRFLSALLHPQYKKRPTAIEGLSWLEHLKEALNPRLTTLSLSCQPDPIVCHHDATLLITTLGDGLPADGRWLQLELNNQTLERYAQPLAASEQIYGFPTRAHNHYRLALPTLVNPGFGTVKVKISVTVNNEIHQAEKLFRVVEQSQTSQNSQAVTQNTVSPSPAETFVAYEEDDDELTPTQKASQSHASQPKTTPQTQSTLFPPSSAQQDATKPSEPLNIPQANIPQASSVTPEAAQALGVDYGNRKTEPTQTASLLSLSILIKGLLYIGLPLLLIFFIWKTDFFSAKESTSLNQTPVSSSSVTSTTSSLSTAQLNTWQHSLNDSDETIMHDAWRSLKRYCQDKDKADSAQACTILEDFDNTTNTLLNSDDKQAWQAAIPRLKLAAEGGDKNAMLWMGYAYDEGRGVLSDWGQAWQWYHRVEQLGSRKAQQRREKLEQKANTILLDIEGTDDVERARAYDVVAAAAEQSTECGDPVYKWMAYRYQIGDAGVRVDDEQAEYWLKKFECR